MDERHVAKIAAELRLATGQVQATAGLIAEGGTIPFIARYRKEVTGSLDEVQITTIRDRMLQLAELDSRRSAVLKSLDFHSGAPKQFNQESAGDVESLIHHSIHLSIDIHGLAGDISQPATHQPGSQDK